MVSIIKVLHLPMHALNLVRKMLSQQNFRGLKEEGSKPK